MQQQYAQLGKLTFRWDILIHQNGKHISINSGAVLDTVLLKCSREKACSNHGTYMSWQLRNRCARKELSLLFDILNAFD